MESPGFAGSSGTVAGLPPQPASEMQAASAAATNR